MAMFVSLALVIGLACLWGYLRHKTEPVLPSPSASSTETLSETLPALSQDSNPAITKEALATEQRSQAIHNAYQELEAKRQELKQYLSRVKHELWGVKLSTEHTKKIRKAMRRATAKLQNQKLLGGFENQTAVKDEIKQIEFAHTKLLENIQLVEQAKDH